jgi:hypothetical protein
MQQELLAKELDAKNKVLHEVEKYNIGNKQQTDAYNNKVSDLERDANINELYNFESKMLTAENVTDEDIRNYYDYNNRLQVSNYNTIKDMNLINELYNNYKIDSDGNVILKDKETDFNI